MPWGSMPSWRVEKMSSNKYPSVSIPPSWKKDLYDNLKEVIKEIGKGKDFEELLKEGIEKEHTEVKKKKGEIKKEVTIKTTIRIGGKGKK
jgi:hypothetical protein